MTAPSRFLRCCLLFLALGSSVFASEDTSRVVNLSTRGQAGVNDNAMIAGFVIGPGAPKTVLIRAVGPGLATVAPDLAPLTVTDPVVTLYQGGTPLATNAAWLAADADTMAAVGAFPLQAGSHDAAVVQTLQPGAYTAVVNGSATARNLALVEVYEVSAGTSHLLNLSTRAPVGTGDKTLIAGLVIAPDKGPRRLLIRAAGPALAAIAPGFTGELADPLLVVRDAHGVALATNDDWGSVATSAGLAAAFSAVGAFPFPDASHDAALLGDFPPGAYTVTVSGVGDTTGIALAEVYDVTPAEPTTVTLSVDRTSTDEGNVTPLQFTFTRDGDSTAPLTVYYTAGGTATNGADYTSLPGSLVIPAGATSATVLVVPVADFETEPDETLQLSLQPAASYSPGATSTATVTLADRPPSLFVADLRAGDSSTSIASGTATLLLSANASTISVSLSFAGLSSPETVTYVRLGDPGTIGEELFRLPIGQVDSATWTIKAVGTLALDDVVAALRAGRFFVNVQTEAFPTGEIRGQFIQSNGSQTFTAPSDPPAVDLASITDTDAARFLTQATFGVTADDIANLKQQGYAAWFAAQLAQPASNHRAKLLADFNLNPNGGQQSVNGTPTRPGSVHRRSAWWQIAVRGPDQLRQRVAFALSELFVVSDVDGAINNNQEALANYNDVLAADALGNFRTLLEDVTLSPMMGVYLSHLRNAKADPVTGAQPDENYAREVMQLFTIGLSQLQPDGTLKLDASGRPVPTYDQTTVTAMARVFTGWAFHNTNPTSRNFRTSPANYIDPMTLYSDYHDTDAKTIVGGLQLPAGQTGTQDLHDALDALFNHPNTGPFVCRQLIQRLVTSNPSPAYVYRVAQVFANNGSGVRGDLAAVVRAILLDYEARSSDAAATASFGKLKEPLLRVTALLRAVGVTTSDGRFPFSNTNNSLSESPLSSPTVFNFFPPSYVQPGDLASAGLVAPEYQILTASTAISVPNYLYNFITNTTYQGVSLDFARLLPLADQPAALTDQLSLQLVGNSLAPATRDRVVLALQSLPAGTSNTDRVRTALYLVVTSPDGAVQK
ncbi:DUF1800 family protein [Horticoccus luteus]|uniref:DUF1800 family protein n=1 Tax=Horticoccus luteus TaxID=2862869 RepID=A0A8F9XK28_9BACT|nr:DUF1800 family protein [Horticoccus luteus]QYM77771.1 DUF1800 family protein [Horticoccus luteus]